MTSHLLAFDIESSGPNVHAHFCPAFGAALVEISTGKELWRFHSYVAQPGGTCWEEECLNQFWLAKVRPAYDTIIAALPTAPSAADAMRRFVREAREAVAQHVPGGAAAVIVISDTAGFDAAWMERMMPLDAAASMRTLLDDKKDIPLRDVNSFFLGIGGELKVPKGMKPIDVACRKLDIPLPTYSCSKSHNPADDASCIAQGAAYVMRNLRHRCCYHVMEPGKYVSYKDFDKCCDHCPDAYERRRQNGSEQAEALRERGN